MPTSIRDLLQTLEEEARYAAGTERQSRDAAGALGGLGRALHQLAQDGLELDVNGRRETIARDLADSCEQNAATMNIDRAGRLTGLAGGVADVAAALRMETGRDQRWAITVEVASAARVLTSYAAEGDNRRTADLASTHLTARALIVRTLKDTPAVQARAVLDRPVPRTMLTPDMSAAGAALESLTVISERLRRSAADLGRRSTLLEVFAVTRAAESTTRYATTTAAALAGKAMPDARPAVAIWYEVRDQLRPFVTSAPLRLEDRDLGLWAQRTHGELRREFGSPDAPQLHEPGGELKMAAVRHLQAMANEIPAIAEHVAAAVQQLADHSELHALADRLPFREQRLDQFLSRHAVVADCFDVVTVLDRLGDAAKLAAEVATGLAHARGPASPELQPDLAAANAARTLPTNAEPKWGLGRAATAQTGERRVEAGQRDLAVGVGFLCGRTRPATALIVAFISEHVGVCYEDADGPGLAWGVESICEQLTLAGCKIAPATYYEHRGRGPSKRALLDEALKMKIVAAHGAHFGVFGARKVWLTLNRQRGADEPPIARCTVERLMGELGLAGAVRGKVKRTTISDPRLPKPHDLVNRNFRPHAPDRLWVADFTYVSTWSGWCYRVRHRRLRPTHPGRRTTDRTVLRGPKWFVGSWPVVTV